MLSGVKESKKEKLYKYNYCWFLPCYKYYDLNSMYNLLQKKTFIADCSLEGLEIFQAALSFVLSEDGPPTRERPLKAYSSQIKVVSRHFWRKRRKAQA